MRKQLKKTALGMFMVAAIASVPLSMTAAQAHCPDAPPTVLSSYTARGTDGSVIAQSPQIDTGSVYCSSERNVPRTIPPAVNTLQVRSPGAVAPKSGSLTIGTASYTLTFTAVTPTGGSASFDSQAVYLDDALGSLNAGTVKATVCFADTASSDPDAVTCKSAEFATVQ